jgi:hypothetical protein
VNPITLSPKEATENPAAVHYSSPNHLVKTVELNSSQQPGSFNFNSRAGKFYFLILCIILLAMGIAPAVSGATRYSVASGNWNATSTWSATLGGTAGASVPGLADIVHIVGGQQCYSNSECQLCKYYIQYNNGKFTYY